VYQAAGLSTSDVAQREMAVKAGLDVIDGAFSGNSVAPQIATDCQRAIKATVGNHDFYRDMKAGELNMAGALFKEVRSRYGDDLCSCVKLACLGNTIDFFKEPGYVASEVRRPLTFAVDHTSLLEERLTSAELVLYLADNAGECFFDLPLVKKISRMTRVVYVVKGHPAQNDITMADLSKAGLLEEMGEVMTTGSDAVGVDLGSASDGFKEHFQSADLVIAKGMANYETLSELPINGRIFHCLMAKCQPIADSLAVPLGSYVMLLR